MSRAARSRSRSVLAAVALTGLLAACSSNSKESGSPTTTALTTTTAVTAPLVVSWTDTFETPLPNGWDIRGCEGERTHVCVYEGDALLGDIELLPGYPLGPGDDVADPSGVAVTWAQKMIDLFRDERGTARPGFTFAPLAVTEAVVGGRAGARGGFTLRDATGRTVEHVVNYYVLTRDTMTIVNTDAYALSDGCLPPSEIDPSFTPEALSELNRYLDQVVADSPSVVQ